eukprot:GHRQ01027317.1.p2 GENE.GHRQ01027317.1~~GHRQ01027317.1.p2  ORF type:complete len:119 (-),score=10.89 GHRQ01027317.1:274-630(-)
MPVSFAGRCTSAPSRYAVPRKAAAGTSPVGAVLLTWPSHTHCTLLMLDWQVYISTIEAKKYPILGLQWHPEKNNYEWTKHKNIPHGYWASEITHQVRTQHIRCVSTLAVPCASCTAAT